MEHNERLIKNIFVKFNRFGGKLYAIFNKYSMEESKQNTKEEKKEVSPSLKTLDNNLDIADTILDKITKIIKKRWGIILLLIFGYLGYWFFNLVDKEIQNPTNTIEVAPTYNNYPTMDTIFYDDGTYELQQQMDTIFYEDGTYELQPVQ